MQGLGTSVPGFVINIVRLIIVPLPLAYLFVLVLGYGYISLAISAIIGSVIAGIIALVRLHLSLKKLHLN